MGFEFAIDELYATGWSGLDTTGCQFASDGPAYPSLDRIAQEFDDCGVVLRLSSVSEFGCYCAEWTRDGEKLGSVVSREAREAAIYALARHRRARSVVGAEAPFG